jgi:hypothetical protein
MAHRRRSCQAEHFEILKLGPIADNKIAKPVFGRPVGARCLYTELIQGLRVALRAPPLAIFRCAFGASIAIGCGRKASCVLCQDFAALDFNCSRWRKQVLAVQIV